MRMISHPMRFDSAGSIATIDDTSARAAGEIATHVISCAQGERPLAPGYGLSNPLTDGINALLVAAAIDTCEDEIAITGMTVTNLPAGRVRVHVDVEWSQA